MLGSFTNRESVTCRTQTAVSPFVTGYRRLKRLLNVHEVQYFRFSQNPSTTDLLCKPSQSLSHFYRKAIHCVVF